LGQATLLPVDEPEGLLSVDVDVLEEPLLSLFVVSELFVVPVSLLAVEVSAGFVDFELLDRLSVL
jgi:hypothetical protein